MFFDFIIDGNYVNQMMGFMGGIWVIGVVECVFQWIYFMVCKSIGLVFGVIIGLVFGYNNVVIYCFFDNVNDFMFEGNVIYLMLNDENFIVVCDFQFFGGFGVVMGMIYDVVGMQIIFGCNFVNGGNSCFVICVQDVLVMKIVGCNFDGVVGDVIFLVVQNCVVESNIIFGIGVVGMVGVYMGVYLEFVVIGNFIFGNLIVFYIMNGVVYFLICEEFVGDLGNNLIIGNMFIIKGILVVVVFDINVLGILVCDNMGGGVKGDVLFLLWMNVGVIFDFIFVFLVLFSGVMGFDIINWCFYFWVGVVWEYVLVDNGGVDFLFEDYNFIIWMQDLVMVVDVFLFNMGVVYLCKVKVIKFLIVVMNVFYGVIMVGSLLIFGQNFVGFYDFIGMRFVVSVDQMINYGLQGLKMVVLIFFFMVVVGYYYVVLLVVGIGIQLLVVVLGGVFSVMNVGLVVVIGCFLMLGMGQMVFFFSIIFSLVILNMGLCWVVFLQVLNFFWLCDGKKNRFIWGIDVFGWVCLCDIFLEFFFV